ncbi:MAG: hypothetical protein ACK5K7_05705 [Bacilli bacterium]
MKRETALKIIAFIFTASILSSFAYILKDIKYLIYALIPCTMAVITYISENKKK